MNEYDSKRQGLQVLLDLHRETAWVGGGWWVTFRAFDVVPSKGRPHGISYSLTLHNPRDDRVLGYDNAHAPAGRNGPGRRTKDSSLFDHIHRRDRCISYDFKSPADLLEDFWRDVEAILKEEGVS